MINQISYSSLVRLRMWMGFLKNSMRKSAEFRKQFIGKIYLILSLGNYFCRFIFIVVVVLIFLIFFYFSVQFFLSSYFIMLCQIFCPFFVSKHLKPQNLEIVTGSTLSKHNRNNHLHEEGSKVEVNFQLLHCGAK